MAGRAECARWAMVAGLALAVLLMLPRLALAQSISLDLGAEAGEGTLGLRVIQLFAIVTLLSLAPGILVMITCFPFILTVLSILRQAIGLQQAPPNMLIVSLALILTWFVMEPVILEAWALGGEPLAQGRAEIGPALSAASEPFRGFMFARHDPDTLAALSDLRGDTVSSDRPPLSLLVPAFLLSEIQRAFEIGFLIFLPFLIIDLVVAAVLMAMGMMMVPPALVALPFKLAFFVVVDGWMMIAAALVRGYQI